MRRFARSVVIVMSLSVVVHVRAAASGVATLRIVPVSSRDDLRRICHFAADLYACTAFESLSLNGACVLSSGSLQWAIVATANIQPVVYLWDARFLGHERLHIEDMTAALRDYVERLEGHRYDSENDCRHAAAAESAGFTKQIDVFAAASNDLRHYKYAARNHGK